MSLNATGPDSLTVTIIIPVYNERDTVPKILDRVRSAGIPIHQIIVVDDASTDGTRNFLQALPHDPALHVEFHNTNRGKGAAIATALAHATGTIVAIQDADLEYDPADLPKLLRPLLENRADVVYGSRFSGCKNSHAAYRRHRWGNWAVTKISNIFTGLKLTDMECCYKAFYRKLLEGITLEEQRFGFEPEITVKLAKKKPRFHEVAVSYTGRTFAEGKKIRWYDGLWVIYAIVKYRLF